MKLPDPGLVRDTGALMLGHAVRVPVLAVYFLLATRSLGVDDYGLLVAVTAVATITAPFAALGGGSLVVKHGAIDPRQTRRWLGAGLAMSLVGTVVVGAALLALGPAFLPHGAPLAVLAALVLAESLLGRVVDLSASVFVAREEMHVTAACQVLFALCRLAAGLVLLALPVPVTLGSWVVALVAGSATAAAVCLTLATRAVGLPRLDLTPYRGHLREGLLFATGIGVQSGHNDVDKALVGRMEGGAASGLYGAAYRIVDMAWMPMRALLAAAHPRMFRHGARGLGELGPFVARLAVPAVGYSVLVSLALAVAAPLVVPLLGQDYAATVPLLRALAGLVVLRCLYYLAADTLTGLGRQGFRTVVQVAVLAVNVALNLVLVPLHGVWGAVWASLVCEGALALALWTGLLVVARAGRRAGPGVAP